MDLVFITIPETKSTFFEDNFNNKIGLQTLQPNETYHVKWSIAIEPCNTHTNQLIN